MIFPSRNFKNFTKNVLRRFALRLFDGRTVRETLSVWGIREANRLETTEHRQRDLASRTLLKMRVRSSSERRSK